MKLDNSLVVIKSNNKKYLTVIKDGESFITHNGKISYNDIKSLPYSVKSSTDEDYIIYTPSYKEFVLLMRRGPQIIYPKDVGSLIVDGNIRSNSTVLEIGTGSGALTLFLLLILGKKGMLYSLDSEVKHQYRASKTINRYVSTFNKGISLKEVQKSIEFRDKSDYERKHSPLKRTKDQVLINSSKLSKKACFFKIKKIMDKKLN